MHVRPIICMDDNVEARMKNILMGRRVIISVVYQSNSVGLLQPEDLKTGIMSAMSKLCGEASTARISSGSVVDSVEQKDESRVECNLVFTGNSSDLAEFVAALSLVRAIGLEKVAVHVVDISA